MFKLTWWKAFKFW